jgi:hypothetical protein
MFFLLGSSFFRINLFISEAKKPIECPVSDAKEYVRFAISQLERIMDDDPEAWKELGKLILWIEKRRRELCLLQN